MNHDILRAATNSEGQFWIVVGVLTVLAAATLEGVVLTLRRQYDWRAFLATLGDVAGRQAIGALGLSLATPAMVLAWQHRITTLPLETWQAFALLFCGQEVCYYWYHRTAHRVRWFWATHSVHHSPNELTLAASLRLGWTGKLTGTALFFVPLIWLGFPPVAVMATLTLNLLYQFWLHATWIPKLGPLEWVLNTPSHHRVHHGSNPEYLDCNYGGVLIVFDRLFGTFVEERDDIAIRYGLTKPITTYNPICIALQEWLALAQDFRAARSWRERAAAVFGPPPTT